MATNSGVPIGRPPASRMSLPKIMDHRIPRCHSIHQKSLGALYESPKRAPKQAQDIPHPYQKSGMVPAFPDVSRQIWNIWASLVCQSMLAKRGSIVANSKGKALTLSDSYSLMFVYFHSLFVVFGLMCFLDHRIRILVVAI